MNDVTRSITLDYEGVASEITTVFDELASIRSNRTIERLVGSKMFDRLRQSEATARKRLNGDFRLMVVGDFKRGKSTLVNALLGQEVVPTAVTPETVTFNHIRYADELCVEAVLANHRRVSLDASELSREKLEVLMAQLPDEIDHVDIGIPSDFLKGLTIVDTPGLGDIMVDFDERVASYLVKADAIVFVVSALSPLSLDERNFLATAVLPQSFSRILVAMNMTDAMDSQEDEDRVYNLLRERAADVSDKLYVFPVSALDELCRLLEQRRPNPERSECSEQEFERFRSALDEDVLFQRDVIRAERGLALANQLLADWETQLSLSRETLVQGVDKLGAMNDRMQELDDDLSQRLAREKSVLASDTDTMRLEARIWMQQYLDRIRDELSSQRNKMNTREIQRFLQFYLTDKIREGMDACTQAHSCRIADATAKYSHDLVGELGSAVMEGVDATVNLNIADVSWSSASTVSTVLNLANTASSGALNGLVLVGDAIGGLFREHQLNKRQDDILRSLLASYAEVEQSVLKGVDEVYAHMSAEAVRLLDESYETRIERSKAAVSNAQSVLQDEDVRVSDLVAQLDDALVRIRGLSERVHELM